MMWAGELLATDDQIPNANFILILRVIVSHLLVTGDTTIKALY